MSSSESPDAIDHRSVPFSNQRTTVTSIVEMTKVNELQQVYFRCASRGMGLQMNKHIDGRYQCWVPMLDYSFKEI